MRHIYIHLHIAKNGGQTFDLILRRLFGRGFVRAPEQRPGHVMTPEEKQRLLREPPHARCISGHAFRYPAPPLAGAEFRYLTFLRHPVARLVSLYAYEQQLTANQAAHASHLPIEAWIEARLAEDNALTNYQTFHLLGLNDPAQVQSAASLAQACQRVDALFFVGLTERFDDSLLLLARRMRRPHQQFYYQRVNATGSRERFPISAAVRQHLLDLNQMDAELYSYAERKLDQALTAIPARRLAAQQQELARLNALGPAALPLWLKVGRRLSRALPR
jgi:hypothetical protein